MEKITIGMLFVLSFVMGFFSYYSINFLYVDINSPFLVSALEEEKQPGNWVNQNQIEILPDKVVLYVPNAVMIEYAPTGSMLPTLGEISNGINIKPESSSQINEGDIIGFKKGDDLIVHRVISKGEDGEGVFFITKGDNNTETDGKVYFQDIEYVTVALVY